MDRRTLRDWVHRYNAEGLAGLENRRFSGRPAKLKEREEQALPALVEAGPEPGIDSVVRWRRIDLRDKRGAGNSHRRSTPSATIDGPPAPAI